MAFLSTYQDIKIQYPFCYQTKDKKNYFRYLEDGRYEYICITEDKIHFSYGTRANTIQGLMQDDEFYFKTLANREIVITNQDFEDARKIFFSNYKNYLSGSSYLAHEVQEIIELKNLEENEQAF